MGSVVFGANFLLQNVPAAAGDRAAAARTSNAAENARPAPATRLLDPQLFMAARHGDSNWLRELLKRTDDGGDEQAGAAEPTAAAAAATAAQVVVEVERRPPPSAAATTSSGAAAAAAAALQLLDGVTPEGDSLLHVVAAAGDGEEFRDCARVIYRRKKGLLVARNNKGDTPLHCAAGAGNAEMISHLVALVADGVEPAAVELVRMRNQEGQTALHQAVRAANEACIDKLMAVDPELACIPNEEDEGDTTSPLYLAISLGGMDIIARCLVDKSNGKLSYSGPDGRNILHAAVSRGEALAVVVQWLSHVVVDEKVGGHDVRVQLLSQLANQRDKQTGSTPLHLAVSSSLWWPPARPRIHMRMGSSSEVVVGRLEVPLWVPLSGAQLTPPELLLNANACCMYQPDHEGLFPIHVAAMTGNLGVVKTLLTHRPLGEKYQPDCATLRDAKGRTFLHAAVEKEMYRVVKYACQMPQFSSVLNAQDNQGDTALHRAIDAGSLEVCHCLLRNPSVRLDISNKKAQKPLDLSCSKIPKGPIYDRWNARCLIRESLECLGAPCGESRADLFHDKYMPDRDEDKESDSLTDQTQVVGIVSGLVATVTFASAFTLPGGYRSTADGGGAAGTPVLAGSYAFNAFILADTLAFICSCMATFNLLYAGAPRKDISIRNKYIIISSWLMRSSVRSLVVAFALGLYLTLAPLVANGYATSIAVLVILSTSLLYGHPVPRKCIRVADMVRARLGIGHPAVRNYVFKSFDSSLVHFWPFIIIFGLPAIKWIKVHHTS